MSKIISDALDLAAETITRAKLTILNLTLQVEQLEKESANFQAQVKAPPPPAGWHEALTAAVAYFSEDDELKERWLRSRGWILSQHGDWRLGQGGTMLLNQACEQQARADLLKVRAWII